MLVVSLGVVLLNHKCNTLSLNIDATLDAIKSHYIEAMQKAEDKLIQIMREEIQQTTYKDAPGKPEWRNQISDMLQEVYRDITDDSIECNVGLPPDLENQCKYMFIRAMIISEGSGSQVGGFPITAGPTGRIVWNDALDGQNSSRAKSEYSLPNEFNQQGNHFVDNAIKRMRKHFSDILKEAAHALSPSVFYDNVTVSGGEMI